MRLGMVTVLFCAAGAAFAGTVQEAYPVSDAPFSRTLRPVTPEDLVERGRITGVYEGSAVYLDKKEAYDAAFYQTLASKKVWHEGTSVQSHERGGPVTWDIVGIPQEPPPPCDQPQPTGFDAEGCRIANSLFGDIAETDPERAAALRETVRRGRDVWFKGTFGNQDLNEIHLARTIGQENMHYAEWMHTKHRPYRYSKWGLINDPDCEQGDESTFWLDRCADDKSTGVLGYRKYFKDPERNAQGEVVFDPRSAPYTEGEMQAQRRFAIGHP
ncbi:MAG: hypothetical protein ACPHCJ_01450, partial [Oceanococcaceae bacterium]